MRTLGPRSVSSVVKILLDIVFVLLCLSALYLGVIALLSAVAMNNPAPFRAWTFPQTRIPILATSPYRAAGLLVFAINVLGMIAVVGRLRKIFVTLIAGNPFQSDNARRLRVIGLVLAGLKVASYGVFAILAFNMGRPFRYPDVDLVAWFSIGVLFILAEVFEEGARLRKDADLTI